ncbi:sulfotransferase domain-containing protein [Planctomycetes bacterium TBK1r]|uniref:Sulfotransferase domain protein n=1 Tax=Stieleria magnilauensis TaxID=2527963 RepID=A0ABX5XKE2_9BACT|nr:Sulfotransferase domain protein [Planctomycetes bacterium TBK1r]
MGDETILKRIARRILRAEIETLTAERDALARHADAFIPTDLFQDSDVFIAGYPKSGNTWLQLMVAAMLYRLDPSHAPDSLVQELVPDIHYKAFYKRFLPITCFKTHALPHPDYKRVLNIVRDGRDVLCSYRSFNEALGEADDLDDMIAGRVEMRWGQWHRHVIAWQQNPFDAEILTVRYEDLKTDCGNQLRRIATFMQLDLGTAELAAIADSTRVDRMQDRERRFGWDNKLWPAEKRFVRRGVSGGYKDEMTAEQIAAFNERYQEALQQLGYPL